MLTVDSNSHALSQDIAISALECGDLAELVELQVLSGDTLSRLSMDQLDVEIVRLRNSEDRWRTWVLLHNTVRG
jgi:hypothetical protein